MKGATRIDTEKKKNEILQAALAEFAEQGFERANTNRICEAADVAKGLIFHYFGSKQQLFLSALDLCIGEIMAYFGEIPLPDGGFTESLLRYYKHRVEFFSRHPPYYKMLMQAARSAPGALREEIGKRVAPVSGLGKDTLMRQFEKLKLKKTVRREAALELLIIVLNAIEQKHLPMLLRAEAFTPAQYDLLEAECGELLRLVLRGIEE